MEMGESPEEDAIAVGKVNRLREVVVRGSIMDLS